MHILWKLKKAFVKELMAGNHRRAAALQHFVDHRNLEQKDTLPITPTENASILPHHCYRGLQKGFMNTAIDNYFNSSYKTWFLCQRRENISQRASEILAMIENPKEKNRLSPRNNNCVFKKLNDGNTIYLSQKSSGLVTLFFWPTIFYCKETFSLVIVGFVSRFNHSTLLVFTKTVWWNQVPYNRLVANYCWYSLKKPFEMDWF
jgi:hypothetical protein